MAGAIALALGIEAEPLKCQSFADGEIDICIRRNVRGNNGFHCVSFYVERLPSKRQFEFFLILVMPSFRTRGGCVCDPAHLSTGCEQEPNGVVAADSHSPAQLSAVCMNYKREHIYAFMRVQAVFFVAF